MILANGELFQSDKQDEILEDLPNKLKETLAHNRLDVNIVIDAFDRIGRMLTDGKLAYMYDSIEFDGKEEYLDMAIHMMSREFLEYKLKVELSGMPCFEERAEKNLKISRRPLGVLFHIAAGNMDTLPVASVAEGLLAGNINILKLPSADKGLTVNIFKMLVDMVPELSDYIYVFDTSSSDVAAMKKMADMSDGIAVWGGDEAISAVRSLAKPGTRIIEWGHKLGFAYVSGFEDKENELMSLAKHIVKTKQLLCSSCQVIYVDTVDEEELVGFAREFAYCLEREAKLRSVSEIGSIAEKTLLRYADSLEKCFGKSIDPDRIKLFRGKNSTVKVCRGDTLELSDMFGNVLVKALPAEKIVDTLRESKEYLQTCGLICNKEKRQDLTERLICAGVLKITRAGNMSENLDGEAHDGEYALERYTKIISVEI